MEKIRIGMIGNLPQPYGGVATTCYHLTREFLAKGYKVCFFDTNRHFEKHFPQDLADYAQISIKKNLVLLVSDMLWFGLFDSKFRSFLLHFIRNAFRVNLVRTSLKITLKTLLASLEMRRYFSSKEIDLLCSQHALHMSFAALLLGRYYFHCPFKPL